MSLEECPACHEFISIKATACPNCAEPLEKNWAETRRIAKDKENAEFQKKFNNGCLWIIAFFVIMGIIGSMLPDAPMTQREKNNAAIRNLCAAAGGSDCYSGKLPN